MVCASATGSAVCPGPAPLDVGALQGAGLVVPTLPSGGEVRFELTCNVTATGVP